MNDLYSRLNGIYQHLALINRRLDNLEKTKKENDKMDVISMLKQDEGFRKFVYEDSLGILSIGYGRNLRDVGISEEEATYLLENDLRKAEADLVKWVPIYLNLDAVRKMVLQCMCYNMGINALLGFRRMLASLEVRDYVSAAQNMLDSLWAREVGARAERLAELMRTGNIPN